jgi:hypothetical protein
MTLDSTRRRRRTRTWTLIGLLQIANAAAFGAVATTVDFSAPDEPQTVANVAEQNSQEEGVDDDAIQPPRVAPPSDNGSADPPDDTTGGTSVAIDAPMPTFAESPISPFSQHLPRTSAPPTAPPADSTDVVEPPSADMPIEVAPPPPAAPVIVNAAESPLTVRFLVNGELVELNPGERRELTGGDAWVVRFHRGGQFGAATEILYGGEYRFVVGSSGWSLEAFDNPTAGPAIDE